ncbi:hypothetical protein JM18_004957 [Phytophthora kernoviae]|uniref:Transmembrane protein 14C n=2 Tax=Phytophthora kernoviae TaxID=325452 RepID=A0A921V8K7_9STRA|nr:hypothetical protein G195_006295 [Phytophthora kernoviae 00238/432]KAG2525318.1 hypothetical protein JM18_004957 [Phytophthora kernoviae]
MAGGNHQAFTYATIVSLAGGAGYALKQHTPSLIGGIGLGVAFLGAGMLVTTDTITDHHFEHGTSLTMSGIIASVMGRRAVRTRLRTPALIATAGALSAGYHVHQFTSPPHKMRYIPGAPPMPIIAAHQSESLHFGLLRINTSVSATPSTMAHHPTYTMAGLLAGGGVFGYLKTKSVSSLVAGVTLGAGFGVAGFLLQKQEMTNGHGLALFMSTITMSAMGLRAVRTKKPVPVTLASLGALSAAYHAQRFTEWVGNE